MFTVTPEAAAHLAQVLSDANAKDEEAARFVLQGEAVTLVVDTARPADSTFTHDDRVVLVLDEQMSDLLSEETLVVHATEEGSKLGFDKPPSPPDG